MASIIRMVGGGPAKYGETLIRHPVQRAPFAALLVANLISRSGNAITLLAVPWYVNETTASAAQTSMAVAAGIVAYVIGGFFGGSLADWFDRKSVSIVADLLSGSVIATMPLLAAIDSLSFGLLLALVFLGALLDSPGNAARFAMTPGLARLGGMSLDRANGLVNGVSNAAETVGLFTAGLLLTVASPSQALLIDALSFGVSVLLTLAFIPAGLGRSVRLNQEGLSKESFLVGVRVLEARQDGSNPGLFQPGHEFHWGATVHRGHASVSV